MTNPYYPYGASPSGSQPQGGSSTPQWDQYPEPNGYVGTSSDPSYGAYHATPGYQDPYAAAQNPYAAQQQYYQDPYAAQQPYYGGQFAIQPFGQPYASTPTDRSNAAMAWWLMFVIGWIGPLIFMGADKPPYVRQNARNAMNLALSTTVYMLISGLLCLVLIGLLLLPVVSIWHLVCMIQGAMKANNGELYEAPGAIKFFN